MIDAELSPSIASSAVRTREIARAGTKKIFFESRRGLALGFAFWRKGASPKAESK